jgi:hypothetical protein
LRSYTIVNDEIAGPKTEDRILCGRIYLIARTFFIVGSTGPVCIYLSST